MQGVMKTPKRRTPTRGQADGTENGHKPSIEPQAAVSDGPVVVLDAVSEISH